MTKNCGAFLPQPQGTESCHSQHVTNMGRESSPGRCDQVDVTVSDAQPKPQAVLSVCFLCSFILQYLITYFFLNKEGYLLLGAYCVSVFLSSIGFKFYKTQWSIVIFFSFQRWGCRTGREVTCYSACNWWRWDWIMGKLVFKVCCHFSTPSQLKHRKHLPLFLPSQHHMAHSLTHSGCEH